MFNEEMQAFRSSFSEQLEQRIENRFVEFEELAEQKRRAMKQEINQTMRRNFESINIFNEKIRDAVKNLYNKETNPFVKEIEKFTGDIHKMGLEVKSVRLDLKSQTEILESVLQTQINPEDFANAVDKLKKLSVKFN